jgi:hypothetical protein
MYQSNIEFASISDWWNVSTDLSGASLQEALLETLPPPSADSAQEEFNPAYALLAA